MLLEDAAPSTGIYIFLRKRIDLENQDTHKYRSISWLSSLLKPGSSRDPSITLINSLQIGIRQFSSAGTGQYLRDLLMELGVNNLGSLNVDPVETSSLDKVLPRTVLWSYSEILARNLTGIFMVSVNDL